MKKVLFIISMIAGIISGGGAAQSASVGSSEDLATLPSVTILTKLEQMRDAIEVSLPIPSRQKFVDVTTCIISVLENAQTPAFQVNDKNSVQQALFSLARTRHFYQGQPTVLNDVKPDAPAQHQIRMLLLGIADQLMARSIYDEEFEKAWEEGAKQGTYPQDFMEELDKSLTNFVPSIKGKNYSLNVLEYLLHKYNSFFDTALQMHHIFPPLINVEKLYREIIGAVGNYRTWTGHGIDGLARWERFDTSGENSLKTLLSISFLSSPRSFLIPLSKDITQTKQEIPSLQYVEDALFDGNHIAVTYNYKSYWQRENPKPLQFVLTHSVNEEIKPFLWANSEIQRRALQEKDHLFLERIRNVYFSKEEEKKTLLESSIEGGEWHRGLLYQYARIAYMKAGEENLRKARKYYKLAADRGMREAQFNYAFMCEKGKGGGQNLVEARKHYQLAADRGLKEGQYNYACVCYNEGSEQGLIEARKYLKHAADQGNKTAQNNYAIMCRKGLGGPVDLEEATKYAH